MNRHPYHLERIRLRKTDADEARTAYHEAIAAAHDDGWSTREIAAELGISHSRVYQIITKRKEQNNR